MCALPLPSAPNPESQGLPSRVSRRGEGVIRGVAAQVGKTQRPAGGLPGWGLPRVQGEPHRPLVQQQPWRLVAVLQAVQPQGRFSAEGVYPRIQLCQAASWVLWRVTPFNRHRSIEVFVAIPV